ncbi:MAG: Lrp/AsnC family transcriptional regulator [Archaeoglobaceae archaeon]|nr:Lrp/AsnC family transcriptional regulator [Archaeoglobaceae archaeon]MDW8118584.1 Lrp/AsnC family transcriptional regulator [Archaeoglobaceae archaeon]
MDSELLMAVQYHLPLSTTPLVDLAEKIGRDYENVEKKLQEYLLAGIMKRYGANLNYRAFPNHRQSSLVGFKVNEAVAKKINELGERVKHNYLRDAYFNVWFTLKARNISEIEEIVSRLAKELGVDDYVILPTKKVYKMDVKYDLHRGISWSYGVEPEKVATINELGLTEEIKRLESLPIAKRPFLEIGMDEEEAVSLIEELIKKGVVRDFSGVLSESKIGFKFNGMNVISTDHPEKLAKRLLEFHQITHLIERIPNEKWNYSVYFMVHAVEKETIERFKSEFATLEGVRDIKVVYSRANLKP